MSTVRVLELLEPRDGGVAEYVRQLALGLPDHDVAVEVAGPDDPGFRERFAETGAPVHTIPHLGPGFSAPADDVRSLRSTARVLRGVQPDLIHLHSAKAGVLGRLVGRRHRVPAIFSPHSFSFVGDFSARRRRFATAIEQLLDPLTAELACVCEHELGLARAHGLRAPASVVRSGVPAASAEEPDAELAAFAAGGLLVASLSALRPQKTIEVLLDAAPEILRRVPAARLAIVGNGSERAALEHRAVSLGLAREERFAFFAFRPPAGRYLQLLDVLALPSSWEALPIGVLEAQAWGVPQVATDVGGTREAVDGAVGALVPARSPAALAGAIAELLLDEDRRRLAAAASRERHRERFTVEHMVAQTAAVYRRVADAR